MFFVQIPTLTAVYSSKRRFGKSMPLLILLFKTGFYFHLQSYMFHIFI